MLTKDLLRYNTRNKQIEPSFINSEGDACLALAKMLVSTYNEAGGLGRQDIQQMVDPILEATSVPRLVARGLDKLLQDRCQFDTAPDEGMFLFRNELFKTAGNALRAGGHSSPEGFRATVAESFKLTAKELSEKVYADHPDRQKLLKFRTITPDRLLHRYNAALVQGLLIRSREVSFKLEAPSPGALRQLFKYVRFHQLLAEIAHLPNDVVQIRIDGPLELFYQTQRYGLQLARFFPAVLHQARWQLEAMVKLSPRRMYQLHLDQNCHIEPYSHHFLDYVPEEVKAFEGQFRKKNSGWEISSSQNFLALEGENYCFPDFDLKHVTGLELALELFHPWHARQLEIRLKQVDAQTERQLLIGVSRELLKDPKIDSRLKSSIYFSEMGFLYRGMPTADRVAKVLKKRVGE